MTDLAILAHPESRNMERQLELLAPRFGDVLGSIMQPERLIASVLIAMDRNRQLYKCEPQSRLMAAMSAAVVGLEVDGVLGQSFMVPFNLKGRGLVAQYMTGYRGYGTLAARGGFVIRAAVVRKRDAFEYDKANGSVTHKPRNIEGDDIVGAWARAVSDHLPALVEFVGIDELLELRSRAKSTSGEGAAFSPWLDGKVGFPAMCEKTPKRRLARSLPLGSLPQFAIASRIDEVAEEQGMHAWADPARGVVIEGSLTQPPKATAQPAIEVTTVNEFAGLPPALAEKAAKMKRVFTSAQDVKWLDAQRAKVPRLIEQIRIASPAAYEIIAEAFDRRRAVLLDAESANG